jgi:hypothetical protein
LKTIAYCSVHNQRLGFAQVNTPFARLAIVDVKNQTNPANRVALAGIGQVLHVGVYTYGSPSKNPNILLASFDNVSIVGNILNPSIS